jgi:hypothetical protein
MLLEVDITSIQTHLMEFGILGIVSFVLGYFAWHSYKRILDRNDALEAKVDHLQNEMTRLLIEERDRMSNIIAENTKAIHDLRTIIINTLIQKEREPKTTRVKKDSQQTGRAPR